ncbi:hypothetical protein B0T17DRAFT_528448 [Bombardia bombarda]|uniref:Uncharacterized protein n=1 Tax=Bombardia bombarda TaxID=252184 RepID=A0AA39XAP9_9PEZI|nr:hypothetical protein B0T17DRAFT_528448 [Bombardia bombarda]
MVAPILLPGFDKATQEMIPFHQPKWQTAFLTHKYTNESLLGIASSERRREIKYGNNIAVIVGAFLRFSEIYFGQDDYWNAIASGFQTSAASCIRSTTSLLIKARKIRRSQPNCPVTDLTLDFDAFIDEILLGPKTYRPKETDPRLYTVAADYYRRCEGLLRNAAGIGGDGEATSSSRPAPRIPNNAAVHKPPNTVKTEAEVDPADRGQNLHLTRKRSPSPFSPNHGSSPKRPFRIDIAEHAPASFERQRLSPEENTHTAQPQHLSPHISTLGLLTRGSSFDIQQGAEEPKDGVELGHGQRSPQHPPPQLSILTKFGPSEGCQASQHTTSGGSCDPSHQLLNEDNALLRNKLAELEKKLAEKETETTSGNQIQAVIEVRKFEDGIGCIRSDMTDVMGIMGSIMDSMQPIADHLVDLKGDIDGLELKQKGLSSAISDNRLVEAAMGPIQGTIQTVVESVQLLGHDLSGLKAQQQVLADHQKDLVTATHPNPESMEFLLLPIQTITESARLLSTQMSDLKQQQQTLAESVKILGQDMSGLRQQQQEQHQAVVAAPVRSQSESVDMQLLMSPIQTILESVRLLRDEVSDMKNQQQQQRDTSVIAAPPSLAVEHPPSKQLVALIREQNTRMDKLSNEMSSMKSQLISSTAKEKPRNIEQVMKNTEHDLIRLRNTMEHFYNQLSPTRNRGVTENAADLVLALDQGIQFARNGQKG